MPIGKKTICACRPRFEDILNKWRVEYLVHIVVIWWVDLLDVLLAFQNHHEIQMDERNQNQNDEESKYNQQ